MKTKFFILLIISLLSINIYAGDANLKGNDLKNYTDALEYADGTNYREALRLLYKVNKNNPNNINVLFNIGVCYLNMSGNPDSALYFLEKVRHLDKNDWSEEKGELLIAIARVHQQKYNFDESLRLYDVIERKDNDGIFADQIDREREICKNAKSLVENPIDIRVKRLSDAINSEYNDYRPILSADQQTLYFTSRRKSENYDKDVPFTDGQFEEAIYTSHLEGDHWTKAEMIKNLSEEKHSGQESATCVVKENTELYLIRNDEIFISMKDSATGEWLEAERVPEPINDANSRCKYAFVTEDGEQMYFVSDREGGFGGYDIWRSFRLPNGQWGVPKNLGDSINTEYDENSPILHPTQNILYFSSAGHNTMGGMDIFYALEKPDSTFEAIQNIGYPINTPDDDIHFVPTPTKNKAYYASIFFAEDKLSNCFDIYEVEYKEPEINTMVVVSGYVNKFPDAHVSIVVTEEGGENSTVAADAGEEVGRFKPNEKTNKFVIILEAGKRYEIVATDGRNEIRDTVEVSRKDCYYESNAEVDLGVFDFVKKAEDVQAQREEQHDLKKNDQDNDSKFTKQLDLTKPYVVQILSLRKPVNPEMIRGIDISEVIEVVYKDGWYVYCVGNFETYSEAKAKLAEVLENSPYDDSFIRNANQYTKYIND